MQQSELVIDSRREKHSKGNGAGSYSSQSKSLKLQQKGLALTNRMKRINSNDLSLQAKGTESGRTHPRHPSNAESDVAQSNEPAGAKYYRSSSHDHEQPNLMDSVERREESSNGTRRMASFVPEDGLPIGSELRSGEDETTDPALLTQSSKINYVPFEELEPRDKPDKEFKKCIAKG